MTVMVWAMHNSLVSNQCCIPVAVAMAQPGSYTMHIVYTCTCAQLRLYIEANSRRLTIEFDNISVVVLIVHAA